MVIILITSFLVVLFFLFRLGLGEESQEQICHNSVIQKSSVLSQVPLQCYRSYVCITEDGTCEGLKNPEKKRVSSLDEIYSVLADEMANCWWMFGEGKLDYAEDTLVPENHCAICSQIYFDDSLTKIDGLDNKEISKDELYNYLASNKYSESQTYSQFILGTNDLEGLKKIILAHENNPEKIGTFGKIDIGDSGTQYWVVTGITTGTGILEWGGAGAIVGTAVVGVVWALSGPPGWIVGSIIFAGTAGIVGVSGSEIAGEIEPEIGAITLEGRGIDNQFMAPTIQEADSEKFKALNCEEILTYA